MSQQAVRDRGNEHRDIDPERRGRLRCRGGAAPHKPITSVERVVGVVPRLPLVDENDPILSIRWAKIRGDAHPHRGVVLRGLVGQVEIALKKGCQFALNLTLVAPCPGSVSLS